MNVLTCPKCQGQMRQYERSGITIDQCGECRGVFLDRGELEKLIDAESEWQASNAQPAAPAAPAAQPAPAPAPQPAAPPPPPQPQPQYAPQPQPYYEDPYHQPHYKKGHYKRRKRNSFLGELFDS